MAELLADPNGHKVHVSPFKRKVKSWYLEAHPLRHTPRGRVSEFCSPTPGIAGQGSPALRRSSPEADFILYLGAKQSEQTCRF